jgi:hypothetical protein
MGASSRPALYLPLAGNRIGDVLEMRRIDERDRPPLGRVAAERAEIVLATRVSRSSARLVPT